MRGRRTGISEIESVSPRDFRDRRYIPVGVPDQRTIVLATSQAEGGGIRVDDDCRARGRGIVQRTVEKPASRKNGIPEGSVIPNPGDPCTILHELESDSRFI